MKTIEIGWDCSTHESDTFIRAGDAMAFTERPVYLRSSLETI
jgi:hypothetical protein